MTTAAEVEAFLFLFKEKIESDSIIFVNRLKNREALITLGIEASYRIFIISELTVEQYSQGPLPDHYGGSSIWVFGSLLDNIEIYIKVTLKTEGIPCVCISFHIAEYPIHYPLR